MVVCAVEVKNDVYIQIHTICTQGRNVVRWRPGQETSLAPPCSKLSSFWSKFTLLKKVFATFLDFSAPPQWFGAPYWLGARGIAPPLPPRVTPLLAQEICAKCRIIESYERVWRGRFGMFSWFVKPALLEN